MSNETPKLSKLVSTSKAVGTFTTLSVSAIALLGATGLILSADLWLPNSSQYAIKPEQNLVSNQATLPEHNYVLGCLPFFPNAEGKPTGEGTTFLHTKDGTQLVSLKTAATEPQQLPVSDQPGPQQAKANQPLIASVRATQASSFTGHSLVAELAPELRGITSVPCSVASNHHWFVSGSTEVGESTYLSIFNPGDNPAQVTIRGWNATGEIAHKPSLTVGPGSLQEVNIATFFAGEERLGLHVSVSGPGAVVALHSSGESGLATRGFETVSGVAQPATEMIFPAVLSDLTNLRIRILNPHPEPVVASLDLADVTGSKAVPGAEEFEVAGASVFELDLTGLGTGPKTLTLRSQKPLVGNLVGTLEGGDKEDAHIIADRIIWAPTQPIRNLQTQLPPLQTGEKTRTLSMFNPTEQAVKVLVNNQEVQVPAAAQVAYEISAENLSIQSETPVYAGLNVKRTEGKTTLLTRLQLIDPEALLPTLHLNLAN